METIKTIINDKITQLKKEGIKDPLGESKIPNRPYTSIIKSKNQVDRALQEAKYQDWAAVLEILSEEDFPV